jgi:hypothetical protein
VPIENLLQWIAAALQRRGRHFDDDDLANTVQQALTGLIQQPAARSPGSRCGFASAPEMPLGSIRAVAAVSQSNVLMTFG